MKKTQIFKYFPNAKLLNIIASGSVTESVEIKLEFSVHAKQLLLKHHTHDNLVLMLKKKRSKIVVFPSESVLKNFAADFRENFNFVIFGSSKFWYPLVLSNSEFVVLATLDEVEGVCFPFDVWVFYELNINNNVQFARSGAENYFLS